MSSPVVNCDCCVPSQSPHQANLHSDQDGEHLHPVQNKSRRLGIALVLVLAAALLECVAGVMSHSLSLVAESGHMVADGVALGLALVAAWMARSPSTDAAPFGYRRVEILAALVNGVGLLGVSVWLGWEAIAHLIHGPEEILSLPMLIAALVGLGVNSINASLLHGHSHQDLNMRGAFLHMIADVVSAVGVLLAAIAISLWHWLWADGLVSLGVAVLIGSSAVPFIHQSLSILLELTPSQIDVDAIRTEILARPGVQNVDGLKVWAIAPGHLMLVARIQVDSEDGKIRDWLLHDLTQQLQTRWGIHEPILQVESHGAVSLMAPLSSAELSSAELTLADSSAGFTEGSDVVRGRRSPLTLSVPASLNALISKD
ncbi:MAG: cation diffusion facilitator family transporter [Elainellaceae cyanobacterium]